MYVAYSSLLPVRFSLATKPMLVSARPKSCAVALVMKAFLVTGKSVA